MLVQDYTEVLAGETGHADETLTVRTRQRLLVELSAWYIRHSIALAGVVSDLDSQFPDLLSPQTLAALASLGPGGCHQNEQGEDNDGVEHGLDGQSSVAGWLEYMQQALNRR